MRGGVPGITNTRLVFSLFSSGFAWQYLHQGAFVWSCESRNRCLSPPPLPPPHTPWQYLLIKERLSGHVSQGIDASPPPPPLPLTTGLTLSLQFVFPPARVCDMESVTLPGDVRGSCNKWLWGGYVWQCRALNKTLKRCV